MQIAMTLPTMLPHGRAETLAWCRGIDEGPFSSLAVPERVTYTSHSWTVEIAAAAALTERVRLWTTVIVLPSHDAVQVAKDLASVDRLADGRLTVGIGVGGREHDYRAISGDFSNRWSRMDEQVATMRRIWAQEPPFEGADPVGPPPVQAGGPPLVAGVIGPKALARAAAWAVGVDDPTSITSVDQASLTQRHEIVTAAWNAAGRTEKPHFSASLWYGLGPNAKQQVGDYVYNYMKIFDEGWARSMAESAPTIDASSLRDAMAAAEAAGCDEFFLVPTTADPAELDRTREALGI
ncbi:MAG: flavin-dependent oxidoreductase, F420-dependent methylene-tetrahydromethanopterin reductase [Ilumatobacteraceae bacterium]|nr:flavin-dependent oxidoreductase, F420-dependent methylene-tetrahydromethanopterin reductase [Ilumatobacteraceae bacterium]